MTPMSKAPASSRRSPTFAAPWDALRPLERLEAYREDMPSDREVVAYYRVLTGCSRARPWPC
jgi:hypothetical protein